MNRSSLVTIFIVLAQPLFAQKTLPPDLKWETNDSDPLYASPEATPGGEANVAMPNFPLTLRIVGPDANTSALYRALSAMGMSLTNLHPNTQKPIPSLATHWAFGKDGKTVYYKLHPKAAWSDGKPVTAKDFQFTLSFMLSKNIMAPWYNNFYGTTYESVDIYDDHTLSVTLKEKKPRIYLYADLPPTPRHFYGESIDADFVRKYNWQTPPVPGPYRISKVEKGKFVSLERIRPWWGDDQRFFKNRFNIDKLHFRVVRESTVEYEWFKTGKLDFFAPAEPQFWFGQEKEKIFAKGYAGRMMSYNDTYRSSMGFWLNKKNPILADIHVRQGIQHAMNFEQLNQTVLRKEMRRLNTTCDGFGPYTHPNIKAREFDLKKADEFFKKAGFIERGPDGIRIKGNTRLSFKITYSSEDWHQRLAALKEEAKKAGLEMIPQFLDWSAAVKIFDARKHDAAFMGFAGDLFPEYWQMWHSTAEDNLTSTNDPKLDAMILEYNQASDEKVKIKLSHQISQWIADDAAYIPALTRDWTRLYFWGWWRFPTPPATKMATSLAQFFDMGMGGLMWLDKMAQASIQSAMKSSQSLPKIDIVDKTYQKVQK